MPYDCESFAVGGCAWTLHQIDAKILAPAVFACAWVEQCGVEVKVKGNLAAWVFALAKCYFCCTHGLLYFGESVFKYIVYNFTVEV